MGIRSRTSSNYRTFLFVLGAAGAGTALVAGPQVSTALSTSGGRAIAPLWTPSATPQAPAVPASLDGDASLRGQIELAKAKKRGEHYEVKLPGNRRARLTLDPEIQERALDVLRRSKAIEGAAVVLGVDGRVLAMAGVRDSEKGPRSDYTLPVSVWAPAASVFKLVTAAALLEAGVKTRTEVCYRGGLRSVERTHLRSDKSRGARCGDLGLGVAKSQNAIIANLAHNHLDKTGLAKTARRLGFGAAPDFAIDVEANRLQIPDDDLERARVAAGFWSSELSPLGGAMVASAIATGGVAINPRIVEAVVHEGGEIPVLPGSSTRVLPEKVAAALTRMMTATCDRGTAYKGFHDRKGRPFLNGAAVAGKTGSLSVSRPTYKGYSWFVGFAPADNPKVVISVLLANPETWTLKAHTAARLILEAAL